MKIAFFDGLEREFVPLLRRDGFSGRPWRFRRRVDSFWHCLEIQRSRSEPACFVNLGATLAALTNWEAFGAPLFKDLAVAACEFDWRLPAPGQHSWTYGTTPVDANAAARLLAQTYQSEGRNWFAQYLGLPGPFRDDTPDDFSNPRRLMLRAIAFSECGDPVRAARFAERVVEDVYFGAAAVALLERIRC